MHMHTCRHGLGWQQISNKVTCEWKHTLRFQAWRVLHSDIFFRFFFLPVFCILLIKAVILLPVPSPTIPLFLFLSPSPRSDPAFDFQLYNIAGPASLVGIHEAEWAEHALCLLLSRVWLILSHEYLPHLVTFLVIAATAFLFSSPWAHRQQDR